MFKVALDRYKVVRPRVWDEVVVKPVPLQPDEDGYGDKVSQYELWSVRELLFV